MGFFTEEIAIDLGTANTLIIHNDKVVINSPSIVAMDRTTNKIIAIIIGFLLIGLTAQSAEKELIGILGAVTGKASSNSKNIKMKLKNLITENII